jgi:AcrR family transcriptional regulator
MSSQRRGPARRAARAEARAARAEARRARRAERADISPSARSQILGGAAREFSSRGYADTSVEHILSSARISRRTFYRFFRNKEEVLTELMETASLLLLQSIRSAILLGKTPDEKLENSIEVFLRAPQTAGPLIKVIHQEATRPGSKLAPQRAAVIERVIGLLDEQVQSDQGRRLDPLLFRAVIAALEQISRYVYDSTPAGEAELVRAKQVMMHIVRTTLDPIANPPLAPE